MPPGRFVPLTVWGFCREVLLMNADEVMRAVGEARDAADAGAAEYLRLTEENERLRAENERLREAVNG